MVVFEYFHFYYMMVLKDFHCRLYSAQKFSLLPWWYLKVSIFSTLSYLGHWSHLRQLFVYFFSPLQPIMRAIIENMTSPDYVL